MEKPVVQKSEINSTKTKKINAFTILKLEVHEPSLSPWYSGIINDVKTVSKDTCVSVIDKGGCIEFILPRGTAQFAEIIVFDKKGNLIWKTQSFNKNTIIWDKQTMSGGRIPKGKYTLLMKQGDQQINAVAMINN
jgi:hypothetical protein